MTGNTFTNIDATDGTIAFQRFNSDPSNTATIDRLNDVDIHGNTFTDLGAGVDPIYLNPTYFGAGAALPSGFDGAQVIIGTADADTIVDTSTGANAIFGDAGNDTITGGAGNDAIDGGEGIDTAVVLRRSTPLAFRPHGRGRNRVGDDRRSRRNRHGCRTSRC